MASKDYFAARESKECVSALSAKVDIWEQTLTSTGYLNKLRDMYAAYHGAYYSSVGEAHQITFGGDEGELVELAINNMRNLAKHMHTMMTSSRPAMETRAVNTDYKSLVQTQLANGLLDYYMRDKQLEQHFKDACEYAIVLGAGYIKLAWNQMLGEITNQQEIDAAETLGEKPPVKEYEGDLEINVMNPLDVIKDLTKEGRDHDWVICRTFKNRFDLIAKYPELEDEILGIDSKAALDRVSFGAALDDETDDIPVMEFYHRRSEALPNGRYMFYAGEDAVFFDGDLPYKKIPVYEVASAKILGTPLGYTDLFDVLPLQDASNSLVSAAMSNLNAFGTQNILNPIGSNIEVSQLAGGLTIIDYNPQAGKPEALDLVKISPELFRMLEMLNQSSETLSGISSVVRGNPEASLRSGSAIAMIQSNAIQFMSGLQSSYTFLIENVGLGVLEILQDFADSPRIANIVGESGKSYMKQFQGEDIDSINRVIVDSANPLTKCLEKGTEILMFDGSLKNVENMEVGDEVMGPDSKVRTVHTIGSGFEPMYKVRSKDKRRGVEYGANESHILTLRHCSDNKRFNVKKGEILDITIKDYLELPDHHRRELMGFKTGVEFEENDLLIPPYILGSWIGDGNSRTTSITTMDDEILNEWTDYATSINMFIRKDENSNAGKASNYHITSKIIGGNDRNTNPMKVMLREMNLLQNKHIPSDYLTGSREQRLQVLAGLLDTDGTLIDTTFVITQKRENIIDDIRFLSESLGFRTTVKKNIRVHSNFTNPDKEYFTHKVTIGGNTNDIPTRLNRKQAEYVDKNRNWLNYGIEVESVGEGEYFGIVLKEEPHFVLGDFSVTHNTISGRTQMADNLLQYQLLKNPEQYINIINTGKLEVGTEEVQKKFNLIKGENEGLLMGEKQRVILTDNHMEHVQSHKSVLDDPIMRGDEALAAIVLEHIQEHISMLQNGDPNTLMALGQQPIPPSMPPEGAPMPPGAEAPLASGEPAPAEGMQDPASLSPEDQAVAQVDAQPQNIRLPEGFEDAPLTMADNAAKNGL